MGHVGNQEDRDAVDAGARAIHALYCDDFPCGCDFDTYSQRAHEAVAAYDHMAPLIRAAERRRIKVILTEYAVQLGAVNMSAQAAVEVVRDSIESW